MRPSKRDELVRKSLKIFYQNGFHATGMDRLAAETGISKTSMYKHFRTKEDLILAALRLRDENFRNWFFRRVDTLGNTPKDRLLAMFDVLNEWFAQPDFRGCMFIKASAEYQEADDPIHAQAAAHKSLLFSRIEELAAQAGAKDPAALARQLLLIKEGAIVTAQLGHSATAAEDAKNAARALIHAAVG